MQQVIQEDPIPSQLQNDEIKRTKAELTQMSHSSWTGLKATDCSQLWRHLCCCNEAVKPIPRQFIGALWIYGCSCNDDVHAQFIGLLLMLFVEMFTSVFYFLRMSSVQIRFPHTSYISLQNIFVCANLLSYMFTRYYPPIGFPKCIYLLKSFSLQTHISNKMTSFWNNFEIVIFIS